MTDTPQPATAGETEVASDPIADAMAAFKAADGKSDKPRNERGQFAPAQEIEAAPESEEEEGEAQITAEEEGGDGTAEEAQPETPLPTGWNPENAEMWSTLPPEARAYIAQREGERDSAVNAKFQEAANLRKANEAVIREANENREKFLRAADDVLSLVSLERPTPQQFGAGTGQYDREGYDLAVAQYEQAARTIESVRQQREQILAQQEEDALKADRAAFESVESQFRPKFVELVPDVGVPEKVGPIIREIADYAVKNGIPENVFSNPQIAARVTTPELMMAWKAMQFDKLQAAKTRVEPKAQKAPAPALKAGAATSRQGQQYVQRQKNIDRLSREGSIEAGAAVFKDIFAGR